MHVFFANPLQQRGIYEKQINKHLMYSSSLAAGSTQQAALVSF